LQFAIVVLLLVLVLVLGLGSWRGTSGSEGGGTWKTGLGASLTRLPAPFVALAAELVVATAVAGGASRVALAARHRHAGPMLHAVKFGVSGTVSSSVFLNEMNPILPLPYCVITVGHVPSKLVRAIGLSTCMWG